MVLRVHLRWNVAVVWVCLVACPLIVNAQTDHKLFNLPLKQLLNISVVSKQSESIAQSPGVVSTYEARQLELMGLNTLAEFVHFVPGVEVNEQSGRLSIVQMRGLPATSNQKVLFMVDGVPYWMPENGEFPLYGLPIQAIEKIEVIRGPGSVVYGTNASAGVINVILRRESNLAWRIYGDNNERRNTSVFAGAGSKNDWWADVAGEIQHDKGYDYQVENGFAPFDFGCFCFPETAFGTVMRQREHTSFLTRLGYKTLSLSAQTLMATETGDNSASVSTPTEFQSEGTLLALNYRHDFDQGELTLFSDWNRYYRDVEIENLLALFGLPGDGGIYFDNQGADNTRFRNGLSLDWNVASSTSVLFGAEYEERSTENKAFYDEVGGANLGVALPPGATLRPDGSFLLVEEDRIYEKSAFAQLDTQVDAWRLVFGARYVNNSDAGDALSPRGSIVYSFNDTESLKLLYSEGFNSPTFRQSAATNNQGVPLNRDIKAETIRTWDLAYTRTDDNLHYVVNLFHIEALDLIRRGENSSAVIERNGLEFELRKQTPVSQLLGGVSYIHEANGHGDDVDSDYASRWLLKLGGIYHHEAHRWGASLRSAGPREGVDAYHLLNLNYGYAFNSGLKLFGTVTNVLSDNVRHPDVANNDAVVIGAQDDIGFLVGFRYQLRP